uniref:Uncharacterized protein n=1 Tax=Anopheles maculatus TaxID=74869 RepID=A0A182TAG5_9DIPT
MVRTSAHRYIASAGSPILASGGFSLLVVVVSNEHQTNTSKKREAYLRTGSTGSENPIGSLGKLLEHDSDSGQPCGAHVPTRTPRNSRSATVQKPYRTNGRKARVCHRRSRFH